MHITTDDRTFEYALKCKHYHETLASERGLISFNAWCINNASKETHARLQKAGFTTHVVINDTGRGSAQHAVALNDVVKNMDRSCINIIADADTAALKYGWDEVIRKLHSTYDCVGIQNPDDVVRHGVRTPKQTWLGKPVPQWVSFKDGIDWSTLDSTPDKQSNETIDRNELRNVYGLSYNDRTLLKDTMWKLPRFLVDGNMTWYVFDGPYWHASENSAVFRGDTKLNTEDEFHHEGVPILTHGRCCRHNTKDPFWIAVERYVSSLSC